MVSERIHCKYFKATSPWTAAPIAVLYLVILPLALAGFCTPNWNISTGSSETGNIQFEDKLGLWVWCRCVADDVCVCVSTFDHYNQSKLALPIVLLVDETVYEYLVLKSCLLSRFTTGKFHPVFIWQRESFDILLLSQTLQTTWN